MADMPQFDHPGMETSRTVLLVMQVFSLLMVLAFCTLFGWLIKRLASPAVRREFGVA